MFQSLSGGGSITGSRVVLEGPLSPGNSVGTLEVEQFTFLSGSIYHWDVLGMLGDLVWITGGGDAFQLSDDGLYTVNVIASLSDLPLLTEYVLFQWAGDDPVDPLDFGTWLVQGDLVLGGEVVYRPGDNQIVLTNLQIADVQQVIPEPGSVTLFGVAGLLFVLRRRRKTRGRR